MTESLAGKDILVKRAVDWEVERRAIKEARDQEEEARQERNLLERGLYDKVKRLLDKKGVRQSNSIGTGSSMRDASGYYQIPVSYLVTPMVQIDTDDNPYGVIVSEDKKGEPGHYVMRDGYSIRLERLDNKEQCILFKITQNGEATSEKVAQVSAILAFLEGVLEDQPKNKPEDTITIGGRSITLDHFLRKRVTP